MPAVQSILLAQGLKNTLSMAEGTGLVQLSASLMIEWMEGDGRERAAFAAGSRVHIYSFTKSKGQMDLDEDTFEQLRPGLSAYADSPEKAAQSLQPLMKKALDTVPNHLHVSCSWSNRN